jgi:transposase InsO family protein
MHKPHDRGEKDVLLLREKRRSQIAITFRDGNQGLVKGLGKIAISPDHSISNVFLVDYLDYNLGLTNVHFEKDRVCSACQAGKQVGTHHPHKNIMTTDRPLELLHMDLFGLIAYISIGGSKCCLVIVDDYSRFTWVFFLQEKSQTQETLKGFLRWAQNEFGLRIKKIRSDNGTKFKNSQIEGFLEEEGIKHEFSSPYTPQQNGVV